jgi:hypothetical protein
MLKYDDRNRRYGRDGLPIIDGYGRRMVDDDGYSIIPLLDPDGTPAPHWSLAPLMVVAFFWILFKYWYLSWPALIFGGVMCWAVFYEILYKELVCGPAPC